MTTITLDGVSSSTIPEIVVEDVIRQITPGIRDAYQTVPGRSGSWLFDEEAGDRDLGVRFAVVGDSLAERRTAVREAATWLYGTGTGRRKLVVSDEADRFHWAKLSDVVTSDELLARGRFSANFRTGPFTESTTISSDTLAGSDTIVVPLVDGIAPTLLPSIEITAGASLASGFTLDVDGVELTYSAALTVGAKVTVSSISATVTAGADTDTELAGVFDGGALAMTSLDGDFPVLRPGSNVVTFTGGAATLAFRWRVRYV